jgi:uncharacterized protein (TIGR02147 family)
MRLGLDEQSILEFTNAEKRERDFDDNALDEVRLLASDTASLVAEWHHYAILELVRLPDFCPDSRWIARVLGIAVDEVNIALQRLLRLGLLSMDAPDRWSDRTGDTLASMRSFTQAALQRLVEQSRDRLLEVITKSACCSRSVYATTTVAVPISRLPEVAERIDSFRRDLLALLQKNSQPDDVYQLEISFFPLTHLNTVEISDGTTRDRLADRDSPA